MSNNYHKMASPGGPQNIFLSMFSLLNTDRREDTPCKSLLLPCVEGLTPLSEEESKISKKLKSMNTSCPHKDRKHYAKHMCNYCYHKNGRTSYAWACPHKDRLLYARGKCHFCYLRKYNSSKNIRKRSRAKRNIN